MSIKEFLDKKSSYSSIRLSLLIIVVVSCACLIYTTIVHPVESLPYIVAALGLGIGGKTTQQIFGEQDGASKEN